MWRQWCSGCARKKAKKMQFDTVVANGGHSLTAHSEGRSTHARISDSWVHSTNKMDESTRLHLTPTRASGATAFSRTTLGAFARTFCGALAAARVAFYVVIDTARGSSACVLLSS